MTLQWEEVVKDHDLHKKRMSSSLDEAVHSQGGEGHDLIYTEAMTSFEQKAINFRVEEPIALKKRGHDIPRVWVTTLGNKLFCFKLVYIRDKNQIPAYLLYSCPHLTLLSPPTQPHNPSFFPSFRFSNWLWVVRENISSISLLPIPTNQFFPLVLCRPFIQS